MTLLYRCGNAGTERLTACPQAQLWARADSEATWHHLPFRFSLWFELMFHHLCLPRLGKGSFFCLASLTTLGTLITNRAFFSLTYTVPLNWPPPRGVKSHGHSGFCV